MSTRAMRYQAGAATVIAATLALTFSATGAEQGTLSGTIKSASGAPIEGVAVSAQSPASRSPPRSTPAPTASISFRR